MIPLFAFCVLGMDTPQTSENDIQLIGPLSGVQLQRFPDEYNYD